MVIKAGEIMGYVGRMRDENDARNEIICVGMTWYKILRHSVIGFLVLACGTQILVDVPDQML